MRAHGHILGAAPLRPPHRPRCASPVTHLVRTGLIVLAALGVDCPAVPARAQEERTLTTPTGWWWLSDATAAQIDALATAESARLIDIEVTSTDPVRYAAAYVQNAGAYAQTWWWYGAQTAAGVASLLAAHHARPIDVDRYFDPVAGDERFAVVMVANTGPSAKSWWWYTDLTATELDNSLSVNNARLLDVESVPATGNFDAIEIANTGADASPWWSLYDVDAATVNTFVNEHQARVLQLEVRDSATPRFDCVLIPNSGGAAVNWWWYSGVTASELGPLLRQNGARLTDLASWTDGSGTRQFAAVMANNSNALTTRIANILGYGTDGSTGLYLKQVGGPVLATLQQEFVFEPASSIKVICLTHAIEQVTQGLDALTNSLTWSNHYSGSCPIGGAPFVTKTLSATLKDMMWFSDNAATNAIIARYGVGSINSTAVTVGQMMNTRINHTPLGCGAPAVASPNTMTLQDAGGLYERLADGSIFTPAVRDQLFDHMQSETTPAASQWWFTTSLRDLIYEEAADLGIAAAGPSYWHAVRLAWKPGGYTLNNRDYVSVAGWVSLPVCAGSQGNSSAEYVFGTFVHGATAGSGGRVLDAAPELFREAVHGGLLACPAAVAEAPLAAPRITLLPASPNPFNSSTTLSFSLLEAGTVRLAIYDIRGREVAVLVDEPRSAGTFAVQWNGTDGEGAPVASGTYLIRVVSGQDVDMEKVVLTK